jgi:outer membrane protein assembly factor BamB
VPWQLEPAWKARFDEPVTAPTVALSRVFVATQDSHRVCALDDGDGARLWAFQAGNRVDTPPTISNGRAYFGTADGHVYCLRASDGALVWRLDANPEVRHVVSHGNVESAWPVHGSVVVKDGTVYFAAGRSSYLDGGLRFYAVDAATGKVLRSTCYSSRFDEQEALEKRARGTFNDILVTDAGSLFLKNVTLDTDTFQIDVKGWSYIPIGKSWPGSPLSAVGGFLDESLFDRVGWILDHRLIAKMLVYNDDVVYGMKWRDRHTLWHGNLFHLDRSKYTVFARQRNQKTTGSFSNNECSLEKDWAISAPARVTSMTLAGSVLFFAGVPWTGEPDDALALLDEKKSGLLAAVDPANGKRLAEYKLEAPPVWDGMAAANESLYMSSNNGHVTRLAAANR